MARPLSRAPRLLLLSGLVAAIGFCLFVLAREHSSAGGVLHYGMRLLTVALCLVAWFQTQAMIGARKLKDGAITDAIHELLTPLHRRLTARPLLANAILIVSSAFIDLFGLFIIAYSILGPNMRPFVALLILFGFRQVSQAVCALPIPPGMIWRNPGFPSLLVTYGTGTDFFFSGHTAIAVLGALELARLSPWLGALAGVVAGLEAFVVLLLRAHYTMDILGAIAAVWCAMSLSDLLFAMT